MSEITTAIQDYRAGRTTWQQLFQYLITRKYPWPDRFKNASKDPFQNELEDFSYSDGTWDEVRRAMSFGWLTRDEYHTIGRERDRLHRRPPKHGALASDDAQTSEHRDNQGGSEMTDAEKEQDDLNPPGQLPGPNEQPPVDDDDRYARFVWQPGDVVWHDENGEPKKSDE